MSGTSNKRKIHEQLYEADLIVCGFDIILNHAHLSENTSAACEFCRKEIENYKRKWK